MMNFADGNMLVDMRISWINSADYVTRQIPSLPFPVAMLLMSGDVHDHGITVATHKRCLTSSNSSSHINYFLEEHK